MTYILRYRLIRERRGVTLLECLVTLSILSVFFLGAYQVYSTTYQHVYVREAYLSLIQDSQRIMASLASDIRQADMFLLDYHTTPSQMVLAALKMRPTPSLAATETLVVYAVDRDAPAKLFRTVYTNGQTTSVELSPSLERLQIQPQTAKLLSVQLALKNTVAGKESAYQVSSAYAMRF